MMPFTLQVYQDPDERHRYLKLSGQNGQDAVVEHPDAAEEVLQSPLPV